MFLNPPLKSQPALLLPLPHPLYPTLSILASIKAVNVPRQGGGSVRDARIRWLMVGWMPYSATEAVGTNIGKCNSVWASAPHPPVDFKSHKMPCLRAVISSPATAVAHLIYSTLSLCQRPKYVLYEDISPTEKTKSCLPSVVVASYPFFRIGSPLRS